MRGSAARRTADAAVVPEGNRWQVLGMEYELLDSYWIHLHQRIWMSALVLIALSMVGMAYLGTGLPRGTPNVPLVTLVTVVGILLTVFWWLLARRMLVYMRVAEYRKKEIEEELGLRTEFYLSALRSGRGLERAREAAGEIAREDAQLGEDLSAFLDSSAVRTLTPMLPGERVVWNLVPILFIAAWLAFWFLMA